MAGVSGVEQQFLAATKIVENTIDAEIERLDNLDGDELETIRTQRLAEMRKKAQKKNEWIANGHGEYSELYEEKEFFEYSKKSENFICHFYRDSFIRCKIVDKHLALLARKHIEAKFVKINVEKAPFLTDRLKIKVLPTICLVREEKTRDYIVGFTDLGNTDEFSTEMLEWRIARAGVIEYSGNLLEPPSKSCPLQKTKVHKKKLIRGRDDDDDDDDDSD